MHPDGGQVTGVARSARPGVCSAPMRALVLGGTAVLGRHLVARLVGRGHEVTLFHRGRSTADRRADVEHVIGDRARDLAALGARTWDVVFDPGGYEGAPVRAAARLVAATPARYVFISTISVYADLTQMHEDGPVRDLADAEHTPLALESYGALKAACERALEAELPGRVLHVRAGLILGPHDYDERFPWWLRRVARGGEVLAPGDPAGLAQAIDARDLAAWLVGCAERGLTGVYNATGPRQPIAMRDLLETLRAVTGSDARFTWVADEILTRHAVAPYAELPFWLPAALGAGPVDIRRALAGGLEHRPFAETARDTWAWLRDGWDREAAVRGARAFRVPAGLSEEREREILRDAGAAR